MERVSSLLLKIHPLHAAIAAIVLVGSGAGGFFTVDWLASDGTTVAANLREVPVQRGDLVDSVTTNGSIVFPERETLSFDTIGVVGEILVEAGDTVNAGEPLARLDTTSLVVLERALADAEVALRDAQDAFEEASSLASGLQLAQAESAVANARLAVSAARDAITSLQSRWGWAFSSVGRPWVAQRVCPTP